MVTSPKVLSVLLLSSLSDTGTVSCTRLPICTRVSWRESSNLCTSAWKCLSTSCPRYSIPYLILGNQFVQVDAALLDLSDIQLLKEQNDKKNRTIKINLDLIGPQITQPFDDIVGQRTIVSFGLLVLNFCSPRSLRIKNGKEERWNKLWSFFFYSTTPELTSWIYIKSHLHLLSNSLTAGVLLPIQIVAYEFLCNSIITNLSFNKKNALLCLQRVSNSMTLSTRVTSL